MKTLAIIILCLASLALTKPTIERQKKSKSTLESLLRQLVGSSLSHELRSGQQVKQTVRGEDEEEERCDVEEGITVPCLDIDDTEAFYECALAEAVRIEQRFSDIYKAESGEDLFREGEMEKVWEVRKSSLVAIDFKEFMEGAIDEIGYYRFTEAIDWDTADDAVKDEITALHCTYTVIRDECYERAGHED